MKCILDQVLGHVMDGSIRYTRDKPNRSLSFAYFTTADGNISETNRINTDIDKTIKILKPNG